MTLLVVPLAADESDMLTLGELDALRSRAQVLFEQPDHPLAVRLEDAGTSCGPLGGDPDPGRSDLAVVCDPASQLVLDLARQGAEVILGPASSPDALSAAHAAPTARRSGSALITLAVIMARLRSDDGCPWDREQTHESLKVHLIEEAHEVLEAIDAGAMSSELTRSSATSSFRSRFTPESPNRTAVSRSGTWPMPYRPSLSTVTPTCLE